MCMGPHWQEQTSWKLLSRPNLWFSRLGWTMPSRATCGLCSPQSTLMDTAGHSAGQGCYSFWAANGAEPHCPVFGRIMEMVISEHFQTFVKHTIHHSSYFFLANTSLAFAKVFELAQTKKSRLTSQCNVLRTGNTLDPQSCLPCERSGIYSS